MPEGAARGRRPLRLAVLLLLGLAGTACFTALGNWQVARRAWKLDLIARVDARVHAPPVPAPGPAEWPGMSEAADEYRRVRVAGRYLRDRETLVVASTERGAGFWYLAPLRLEGGGTVLVNRGFVPGDRAGALDRSVPPREGRVEITGLLRMSQPGGLFQGNDPAGGWWYSRDVAAIAAARGLEGPVAPFFVDADLIGVNRAPIGGMTVVSFRNSHLVYALTWYGLALMAAGATFLVLRWEWRRPGRA